MSTTTGPITPALLDEALGDERHLGWGYATRDYLAASKQERLDRAVVAVANEMSLDYERLFHWTNSKWGRWLVDGVSRDAPTRATVRRYLNEQAVSEACDV